MFRVNMVFFLFYFFFFFAINKKILHRYLNTSSSFSQIRTFVCLKLMDTIEYMNRQEQEKIKIDCADTLSLTFAI